MRRTKDIRIDETFLEGSRRPMLRFHEDERCELPLSVYMVLDWFGEVRFENEKEASDEDAAEGRVMRWEIPPHVTIADVEEIITLNYGRLQAVHEGHFISMNGWSGGLNKEASVARSRIHEFMEGFEAEPWDWNLDLEWELFFEAI